MSSYLFLDVSNLAYRAFHTTGMLSHEGIKTGVLFGIFRDVLTLAERFGIHPDRVAFFFDARSRRRREVYADYKINRKIPESEDAKQARMELYFQLDMLHMRHLPEIGYRNIFHAEGYEADDLIASACEDLGASDEAVVVSTDQDLFQLLQEGRVTIWNPVKK